MAVHLEADTSTMQFLLAGAIFILLALLAAKIFLDRSAAGAVREHDPARARRLSRELLSVTSEETVHAQVADTSGRVGLALLGGDRLLLMRATWTQPADPKAPESVTFDTRLIQPTELVDSRLRELFSSRTRKDGASETLIGAVELLLFLDDLDAPVVTLDFLESDVRSGSDDHEAARDAALRWEGMVRVLVFRGSRQNQAKSQLQALQSRVRGP